jgi:hypothetical protein
VTKFVEREIEDNELQPGDAQYIGDKKYVLQEVYEIGYNKCPLCKSKKTYHSTRLAKDVTLPNTIATTIRGEDGLETLIKKDICLKCGHSWVGQMYIWKVYVKDTWLERQVSRLKRYWSFWFSIKGFDYLFTVGIISVFVAAVIWLGVNLLG